MRQVRHSLARSLLDADCARRSVRRAALAFLFAVAAFAMPAQAVIFCRLHDEFDDGKVVRQSQENDQRVKALKAELEAVRKQLLRLKERDFIALFGEKTDKPGKTYALPCFEWRAIALSGIMPADPKKRRRHTDFYVVGDFAGLEVYYGNDGESPMTWLLYFRVGEDFTSLKDAADLEKRLAWDRARLEFFNAWLERRMVQVFPYEVDEAAMRKLYSGEESLDVRERLRAWIAAGERLGLTLKKSIRHGRASDAAAYRWLRPDGTLAREAYHGLGYSGDDLPPTHFYHYYHNADGKYYPHRESYSTTGHNIISGWRWRRPGGALIQSQGGDTKTRPCPTGWSWYDETNHSIRYESDDNGDAIPDWVAEKFDMEGKGRRPLSLDESWAIHPELVPEIARIPGDFQPRLIIRRRSGPKPLPPPPWAGQETTAPADPREAPAPSATGQAPDERTGIPVSIIGFLTGALAVVLVWMLAWCLRRRRNV